MGYVPPLLPFINSDEPIHNIQGFPEKADYIEQEDGSVTWHVHECETIQRMSEAYRSLPISERSDDMDFGSQVRC